jgi:hypothetical protein
MHSGFGSFPAAPRGAEKRGTQVLVHGASGLPAVPVSLGGIRFGFNGGLD